MNLRSSRRSSRLSGKRFTHELADLPTFSIKEFPPSRLEESEKAEHSCSPATKTRLTQPPESRSRQPENPRTPAQTLLLDEKGDAVFTPNTGRERGYDLILRPYQTASLHLYSQSSGSLNFGPFRDQGKEAPTIIKKRAPDILQRTLSHPNWKNQIIAITGEDDAYQPAERLYGITRQCLQVCIGYRQPLLLTTRNYLITRDLDLLAQLASFGALHITVCINTLDSHLAERLEPRSSLPKYRLKMIEKLTQAGIPVGIHIDPLVLGVNQQEIPDILEAARKMGARTTSYTLHQLTTSQRKTFYEWLEPREADRAHRVSSRRQVPRAGTLRFCQFPNPGTPDSDHARKIDQLFQVYRIRLGYAAYANPLRSSFFKGHGEQQLSLALV